MIYNKNRSFFYQGEHMKKVLCLLAIAAVACAACSKNKNTAQSGAYGAQNAAYRDGKDDRYVKDAKYQIIDQEFDNMLAPASDYDNIPAYELQACGDSYLPLVDPDCCGKANAKAKGKAKAKAKGVAKSVSTARAKKVTNTTNIYYVDGPNPDVPVSSTTTTKTVYSSGAVSSSTSTSSNTKTTQNADGSVTTTTVSY